MVFLKYIKAKKLKTFKEMYLFSVHLLSEISFELDNWYQSKRNVKWGFQMARFCLVVGLPLRTSVTNMANMSSLPQHVLTQYVY